jgi:hypothetical protein
MNSTYIGHKLVPCITPREGSWRGEAHDSGVCSYTLPSVPNISDDTTRSLVLDELFGQFGLCRRLPCECTRPFLRQVIDEILDPGMTSTCSMNSVVESRASAVL